MEWSVSGVVQVLQYYRYEYGTPVIGATLQVSETLKAQVNYLVVKSSTSQVRDQREFEQWGEQLETISQQTWNIMQIKWVKISWHSLQRRFFRYWMKGKVNCNQATNKDFFKLNANSKRNEKNDSSFFKLFFINPTSNSVQWKSKETKSENRIP